MLYAWSLCRVGIAWSAASHGVLIEVPPRGREVCIVVAFPTGCVQIRFRVGGSVV